MTLISKGQKTGLQAELSRIRLGRPAFGRWDSPVADRQSLVSPDEFFIDRWPRPCISCRGPSGPNLVAVAQPEGAVRADDRGRKHHQAAGATTKSARNLGLRSRVNTPFIPPAPIRSIWNFAVTIRPTSAPGRWPILGPIETASRSLRRKISDRDEISRSALKTRQARRLLPAPAPGHQVF